MRAEDVLPDDRDNADFGGTTVRKGTVGAFLANARIWRDPLASQREYQDAERDLIAALPALQALGVFELLAVRDDALRALINHHLTEGTPSGRTTTPR